MKDCHPISESTLVRAGHRLLTNILAAYDLDELRRDSDPDPLDDLRQFEIDEQTEALITLAAIARVLDDDSNTLKSATSAFPQGVGWLHVGGRKNELSIREACNKIIHARKVGYEFDWCEENPLWGRWYAAFGHEVRGKYKAPALTLSGSQGRSNWEARVELIPFVVGSSLVDVYKWNLGGKKVSGRKGRRSE